MATSGDAEQEIEVETEEQGCSSAATVSFLSRLKAPTQSDLMRKRKVRANNPPHTGARNKKPSCSTDPKNIRAIDRVREFKDEMLTVSSGKLFCSACREELSLKLSIVKKHVQSSKHTKQKEQVAHGKSREHEIAAALKAYELKVHPSGETLSEPHKLYRIKVVTAFMTAGVPLSKVEFFRPILEENAYRLCERRGLFDLVPFVHSEEQNRIKANLNESNVSVIFDGTTRLGEAMVVVLRVVIDFEIKQYLVRFQTLAKSMTGEEIARELICVLSVQYGITPNRLLAAMRDRASVNGVAIRTLKILYPDMLDIGCYSHTIDLVGDKFVVPHLDKFIQYWVSLFAHSPRAKLWWKARTGKAMRSHSSTRWWSKWEVMHQAMIYYGDIVPFLEENPEMSPSTTSKLLAMLRDPTVNAYLQIELAAVIDVGQGFVKATYNLEGDGPLALSCFEILTTLTATIQTGHYPNIEAIAQKLSAGSPVVSQQWVEYAKSCVKPGAQYFVDKFSQELSGSVAAFRAARFFSPHKVVELKPTAAEIDSLKAFPFLNNEVVLRNLKSELPSYLAKADGTGAATDPIAWWKSHALDLPHWSKSAADILLVQPSSAAAERVFSLLNSSFGPQQDTSLNDYIESSLMLQYNNRK